MLKIDLINKRISERFLLAIFSRIYRSQALALDHGNSDQAKLSLYRACLGTFWQD